MKNYRLPSVRNFLLLLTFACLGCTAPAEQTQADEQPEPAKESTAFPDYGNVLNMSSEMMDILLDAQEIPAGLTTLRYTNNSSMTHFVVLEKMPVYEGVQTDVTNTKNEVVPVFDEAMSLINEGKMEEGMAAFAKLPPWFNEVAFTGGIGLTGPGLTSQAAYILEPGTYTLECYVKSDGKFHSVNGMLAKLVVTENASPAMTLPETDLVVDVNENGIALSGAPLPGKQTFRVNYNANMVHENFVMADINVVSLDGVNSSEVQFWINWLDPNAFGTPCPATFVGGLQEMAAGNSGVFTVQLDPGEYALISEIPESGRKGFYKSFTVPAVN